MRPHHHPRVNGGVTVRPSFSSRCGVYAYSVSTSKCRKFGIRCLARRSSARSYFRCCRTNMWGAGKWFTCVAIARAMVGRCARRPVAAHPDSVRHRARAPAGRVHDPAAVRAPDVPCRHDGLLPGVEVSRRISERGGGDCVRAGSRQLAAGSKSRLPISPTVRCPLLPAAGCPLPAGRVLPTRTAPSRAQSSPHPPVRARYA